MTEKKYKCDHCNHTFTQKNNMYSHMKNRCKIKKRNEDNLQNIHIELKRIKEMNEKLEERIKILEAEKSNIQVNTVNAVNAVNTVNNFNNMILVGYGKEDMKKIDKNDILKSMKSGFYSTLQLTDTIHFNPKYPEYHNIYISNIKDKYGMVYDGNEWTLLTKTELVDKVYDEKKNFIESNIDDFCESISKSQKNALERWMNIDDDHPKIKEVKDNIKLLLYNKRNIPLKQKENMRIQINN